MNPYNVTIPNHLTNEVQRQHICEELYLAYKANILEANRIASAAGARFFHFLQPNLFTMGKRTKYEEALIRNRYITPVGFEIAVRIAYPVLRKVVSDIAAECRSSDFSTLLSLTPVSLMILLPTNNCKIIEAVTIGPIPKEITLPKSVPSKTAKFSNLDKALPDNPYNGIFAKIKKAPRIIKVHFAFTLKSSFFSTGG